MFVCQAEDGIRDLVRSRGLGDVYKRQLPHRIHPKQRAARTMIAECLRGIQSAELVMTYTPVSYTHLTLPTSDLV